VAIYLQETGRSYENPVDSEDYNKTWNGVENVPNGYQITYEDEGPGGYKFGRDEVFYIGDRQKTCVAFCDSERNTIYRWYSGKQRDHLYTKKQELDSGYTDFRSYNREPRQRSAKYFTLMKSSVSGTTALYRAYDSGQNDSRLQTGSGSELLGYIWSSQSAATSSGLLTSGESILALHEYIAPSNGRGTDHFYTINPAAEVNLQTGVPGVPDCKEPGSEDYQYVGVVGYVTLTPGPKSVAQYLDIGGPQSTGLVNRSGWYSWDTTPPTTYTEINYLKDKDGVPATSNYGWGFNVGILSTDAYFEWYYGKNAAVKASVPRSLNFHDAFEGQFVFYLYDTTNPWNGPIYGINFFETDAPCLPTTYQQGTPPPEPTLTYHTYNYEIDPDVWRTQKTHIFVDAPSGELGANESFWTAGTDDHRIFFRYTTSSGFFLVGERINGWMITACRYFGDEMNCGYMELTQINQEGTGNTFSYGQTFTSDNGGGITVLAGYGIKNKAAFWGVYEFPKQVTYTRVEIDKNALIPQRSIDSAVIQCKINKQGQVTSVNIVNSGKDYVNPQLSVEFPETIRDQGFVDPAQNTPEFFEDDSTTKVQLDVEDETDFARTDKQFRKSAADLSKKKYVNKSDFTGTLEEAEFTAVLDERGSIIDVIITNPGRGYAPGRNCPIIVVDREQGKRTDTYVGEGMSPVESEINNSLSGFGVSDAAANAQLQADRDVILNLSQEFNKTKEISYNRGYIKMGDVNIEQPEKFCNSIIPGSCFSPNSGGDWADFGSRFDQSTIFNNLRSMDPNFNANNPMLDSLWSQSKPTSNLIKERMSSGMPGIFPGGCIEVATANLYSTRRFFDIPCPYVSYNADGDEIVYGYMPFKYCASKQDTAKISVSIQVEGDVSGAGAAVNTRFMNWLKSLNRPQLTRPRKFPGSGGNLFQKTHPCSNGAAKGRCFESSNGQYTFVPIGGDENTFDYGLNQGMTELDQLETWISDNYSAYTPLFWFSYEQATTTTETTDPETGETTTTTTTGPTGNSVSAPYNSIVLDSCSGGQFPSDCWHNFVDEGVLTVNSGYTANGSEISAVDICSSPPFAGCLALDEVVHAAIAIDPKRINQNNWIEMGPYEGTMLWRNFSTGAARLLDQTLNNFGNPYFDECDITFDPL